MSRIPALDTEAAKGALRLTLVATLVFAIGQVVLDNPNVALFAFFGSFALLVFAQFAGPASSRLHAYLGLAAVGFPLIALGTVCSHDAWIAGGAMALVGFAILFSGIANGYVAASAISAVLLFVLPVMIPAPDTQIPDRLAGWAMACAVAVPAALLLWPARPQQVLRRSIAEACRAIAACLEIEPGADSSLVSARAKSALTAAREARRRFSASPYRPTGATGPTSAVAHLVDDVAWITPLATETPPQNRCFPTEGTEAKEASKEVLHASAALLEGQDAQVDLDRLQRSRSAIGTAFRDRLAPDGDGADDLRPAFDQAFRLRFLSYGIWQIGVQALLTAGRPAPELSSTELEWRASETGFARPRVTAIRRLIAAYSHSNAVWLRNSLRGAVALGTAVLLGQLFEVQHGFWVVLGTLSVLRSNALNTGSTIIRSLAGTVIGIVVGALIIVVVGTDTTVLWVILPVTLVLAAYAPRAISFAAGQAAFTVAVLTLFDLIQPSGWQVGLVRVEDIAIGCLISFGVGLLFWPRGAAGVVRDSIAEAYARTADYLARSVQPIPGGDGGDELDRSAGDAAGSLLRLDDAMRQYLAERSASRLDLGSLGSLTGGAMRVLRVGHAERSAHALFRLTPENGGRADLIPANRTLQAEVEELRSWYHALGTSVAGGGPPPAPLAVGAATESQILEWTSAHAGAARADLSRGLAIAWSDKLLDTLRGMHPMLADASGRLAGDTQRPAGKRGSEA